MRVELEERIVKELTQFAKNYHNREDLAKRFGVSSQELQEKIQSIQEQGYEIEDHPILGYRLLSTPDLLLANNIKSLLRTGSFGRVIYSFQSLKSTNDTAKKMAQRGAKEGTLVIGEKQTKGKGRLGRRWDSPAGLGIWASLILRPEIPVIDSSKLTLIAALSVTKAIRNLTGLPALIRWPNDVLISGKKVCGILTEIEA